MSSLFHIGLLLMSLVFTQSRANPVKESVSDTSVLSQTSKTLNSCTNTSVFSNLYWENVPVLDVSCNMGFIESIEKATILLKYDVVSVLCMGFYETSLILCKSPLNSSLNEVFPATSDKMKDMMENITKQNDYASLTKFCKSTVKNFANDSFNGKAGVGGPWHEILQHELKVENECTRICSIDSDDGVHPLCSFIVWSYNQVSQPTHHIQKVENKEITPIAKEDSKVNVSTATAVTELLVPAPPQKVDSAKAGGSNPVSSGGAIQSNSPADDKEEQSVNGDNAVAVPPQQTDKRDKPVDASKVNGDKKTDTAGATTKSSPSNTDLKEEKNASGDVVKKEEKTNPEKANKEEQSNLDVVNKVTTKESDVGEQPPPEENLDVGQTGVERPPDGADNVADEEENNPPPPAAVPQDDVDAEGDGDNVDGRVGGVDGAEDDDDRPNVVGDPQKSTSVTDTKDDVVVMTDNFIEPEDPHFFTYFLFMSVLTILAYLAFHNKNKLLALAVEGRRAKGARRRPNSSNYSKLHCSLEEAMSSKSTASVTHVLY